MTHVITPIDLDQLNKMDTLRQRLRESLLNYEFDKEHYADDDYICQLVADSRAVLDSYDRLMDMAAELIDARFVCEDEHGVCIEKYVRCD